MYMHEKVIVTTTINPPTEALIKFSQMEDWTLIVVADLITPLEGYSQMDCIIYSTQDQETDFPELSGMLGWKTIERRNLGFLKALELGAEIIATVDDDNVPLDNWGQDLIVGTELTLDSYDAESVFDPISVTNYPHLWHRGFPIQRLTQRAVNRSTEKVKVDIEASFWNGDPDIDAICRMQFAPECEFDTELFPFTSRQISPFNSQNTFLTRAALKKYFMFPFVGRMDDIWGAYHILSQGFRVAYTSPSVFQLRNPHDLTIDFELETLGYKNTHLLIEALGKSSDAISQFISARSLEALREYLSQASKFD